MSKIAIVAKLRAVPGRRDDVIAAFKQYIEDLRADGSPDTFAMHTIESEPDCIWFYELYADQDAYDRHMTAPARQRLQPKLEGLRAGRAEVHRITPVAAYGLDYP